MNELLALLTAHAATAALLALGAAILCRKVRHAAVIHTLCVVVLLKLMTPPLVEWAVLPTLPSPGGAQQALSQRVQPLEAATLLEAATPPEAVVPLEPATPPKYAALLEPSAVLLAVWMLGSSIFLVLTAFRLRRFALLSSAAFPASMNLRERVERLAAEIGLKRTPSVRLLPVRLSPMVWPRPGGAEILLPEALLPRLRDEELDAVLLHELAHLRRRDHLVRLLELAATIVFWWHPAVWWARGRLRRAEEHACDAWVVHTLPDQARAYAEGLLKTLEHLADSGRADFGSGRSVPVPATGIEPHEMKERLTMILTRSTPQILRPRHRAFLGVAAITVLAVLPTWADPQDENREEREYEERMIELERRELALEDQMRMIETQRRELEAERLEVEITAERDRIRQQIDAHAAAGHEIEAEALRREAERLESESEMRRREMELDRERSEELLPLERQMHEEALRARELALSGRHDEAEQLHRELSERRKELARKHVEIRREHIDLERERVQRHREAIAVQLEALREAGHTEDAERLEHEKLRLQVESQAADLRKKQMNLELKHRLEAIEMRDRAERLRLEGRAEEAEAMRARVERLRADRESKRRHLHGKLQEIQHQRQIQELKVRAEALLEMRENVSDEELEAINKELHQIKEEMGDLHETKKHLVEEIVVD